MNMNAYMYLKYVGNTIINLCRVVFNNMLPGNPHITYKYRYSYGSCLLCS